MNKDCPICQHRFFDTDDADDVCVEHELWFVIKCFSCGRYAFSDIRDVCPECLSLPETA